MELTNDCYPTRFIPDTLKECRCGRPYRIIEGQCSRAVMMVYIIIHLIWCLPIHVACVKMRAVSNFN